MIFGEYLKSCRERYDLTQEQLAQELYNFDEHFSKIDAVTISRWERGLTMPSLERLKCVLKFFQKFSKNIFPCFEDLDQEYIQNKIYKTQTTNISKTARHHIVDFPKDIIEFKDIKVITLTDNNEHKIYTKIAHMLDKKLTNNYSNINHKNFKELALHPSSLFLVSIYEEQFFGLFFSIKLKEDVFKKIINLEMCENDLSADDLADVDEKGSLYFISFFAISDMSVSILILRFYEHLILNQNKISDIARVTKTVEGEILSKSIGLHFYKKGILNNYELKSYKANISQILLNDDFLKIVFNK